MTVYATTPWECVQVSEATAKYLRLDEYKVWSRLMDGISVFLVLRAEQTPGANDGGYHSIDSALRTKGLR